MNPENTMPINEADNQGLPAMLDRVEQVITSFYLRRIDRQRQCLESWERQGLSVVGVQTEFDFVDQLGGEFPSVQFVTVPPSRSPFGVPHLPYVADLIKQATTKVSLVLNSDIELSSQSTDAFFEEWRPVERTLKVGVRVNQSKTRPAALESHGIDAFLITPDLVDILTRDINGNRPEFVIGRPGFDFFLPWIANLRGYDIAVVKSGLYHASHSLGWDRDEDFEIAKQLKLQHLRIDHGTIAHWIQYATKRGEFSKPAKRPHEVGRGR